MLRKKFVTEAAKKEVWLEKLRSILTDIEIQDNKLFVPHSIDTELLLVYVSTYFAEMGIQSYYTSKSEIIISLSSIEDFLVWLLKNNINQSDMDFASSLINETSTMENTVDLAPEDMVAATNPVPAVEAVDLFRDESDIIDLDPELIASLGVHPTFNTEQFTTMEDIELATELNRFFGFLKTGDHRNAMSIWVLNRVAFEGIFSWENLYATYFDVCITPQILNQIVRAGLFSNLEEVTEHLFHFDRYIDGTYEEQIDSMIHLLMYKKKNVTQTLPMANKLKELIDSPLFDNLMDAQKEGLASILIRYGKKEAIEAGMKVIHWLCNERFTTLNPEDKYKIAMCLVSNANKAATAGKAVIQWLFTTHFDTLNTEQKQKLIFRLLNEKHTDDTFATCEKAIRWLVESHPTQSDKIKRKTALTLLLSNKKTCLTLGEPIIKWLLDKNYFNTLTAKKQHKIILKLISNTTKLSLPLIYPILFSYIEDNQHDMQKLDDVFNKIGAYRNRSILTLIIKAAIDKLSIADSDKERLMKASRLKINSVAPDNRNASPLQPVSQDHVLIQTSMDMMTTATPISNSPFTLFSSQALGETTGPAPSAAPIDYADLMEKLLTQPYPIPPTQKKPRAPKRKAVQTGTIVEPGSAPFATALLASLTSPMHAKKAKPPQDAPAVDEPHVKPGFRVIGLGSKK